MVTFASETEYSDYQIIGCVAPGVKLAAILLRRHIGTSEIITDLSNRQGETGAVRLQRGNGGRLPRSSKEGVVMTVERRGQHVCVFIGFYNR